MKEPQKGQTMNSFSPSCVLKGTELHSVSLCYSALGSLPDLLGGELLKRGRIS